MCFGIVDEPGLFDSPAYQPRLAVRFEPARIVLAKGSVSTPARRKLAEGICSAYPAAEVIEALETPHNRVSLGQLDALGLHYEGKRTLVLAEHRSAVRQSAEEGNSCPNYWHFSPYGFCPYGCDYCYLAGTQGVRFSPTVKVFMNLTEILDDVDRIARSMREPTAFYLGKLQDGLALDPLSGYSRQMIPFFAEHPIARLILLTKSADVRNLLDLDPRGRTILSWTVNPAAVVESYEKDAPSLDERLRAMEACSQAGYIVRAVVMPIVPVPNWEAVYRDFLVHLLSRVRLARITFGSICSYPQALSLTEQKIGRDNAISVHLDRRRSDASDGRIRFPRALREIIYRHLLGVILAMDPRQEVGLCLEEPDMLDALGLGESRGRCNCVL